MKKNTKLGIWEVWNEYIAESVFVDHKPTKEEILELFRLEEWDRIWGDGVNKDAFIKKYVHVEQLKIYQTKK